MREYRWRTLSVIVISWRETDRQSGRPLDADSNRQSTVDTWLRQLILDYHSM